MPLTCRTLGWQQASELLSLVAPRLLDSLVRALDLL